MVSLWLQEVKWLVLKYPSSQPTQSISSLYWKFREVRALLWTYGQENPGPWSMRAVGPTLSYRRSVRMCAACATSLQTLWTRLCIETLSDVQNGNFVPGVGAWKSGPVWAWDQRGPPALYGPWAWQVTTSLASVSSSVKWRVGMCANNSCFSGLLWGLELKQTKHVKRLIQQGANITARQISFAFTSACSGISLEKSVLTGNSEEALLMELNVWKKLLVT